MEFYIKKINHKVITNNNEQKQKRIKKLYLIIGGTILGVGLAGFLASFISFMVLFFKFETDEAMTAWLVAIPFILMFVAGAVVTRIGDMLLKESVELEYERDLIKKEEKEEKKKQKKLAKEEKLKAKSEGENKEEITAKEDKE